MATTSPPAPSADAHVSLNGNGNTGAETTLRRSGRERVPPAALKDVEPSPVKVEAPERVVESKRNNDAAGDDSDDSDDGHNELCEVCSQGGELLCCDTCSLVFHPACVRPALKYESGFPSAKDAWSCAHCVLDGTVRANKAGFDVAAAKRFVAEMSALSRTLASRRYRGVVHKGQKYRAQIQINGKQLNLGKYSTSAEAALRYDAHARKAFGDRAKLNFPKPNSSELAHFEDANDAAAAAAALAACPPGAASDAAAEATAAAKLDPGYAISLGVVAPASAGGSGGGGGAASDARAGSSSSGSNHSNRNHNNNHNNNHKRARDGEHGGSTSSEYEKSKRYGTSADQYLFNLDASNGSSSGRGATASRLAGGGGDDNEAVMSTRHANRRRPSESTEPRVRQRSRTWSEKLDESTNVYGSPANSHGGVFSNGLASSSLGSSAALDALNKLSERRASSSSSSGGGGGGSHHSSRPRKGGSGGAREATRALVREALAIVRLLRHRSLSDAEVHDLDSLVQLGDRSVLESMRNALQAQLNFLKQEAPSGLPALHVQPQPPQQQEQAKPPSEEASSSSSSSTTTTLATQIEPTPPATPQPAPVAATAAATAAAGVSAAAVSGTVTESAVPDDSALAVESLSSTSEAVPTKDNTQTPVVCFSEANSEATISAASTIEATDIATASETTTHVAASS